MFIFNTDYTFLMFVKSIGKTYDDKTNQIEQEQDFLALNL